MVRCYVDGNTGWGCRDGGVAGDTLVRVAGVVKGGRFLMRAVGYLVFVECCDGGEREGYSYEWIDGWNSNGIG